MPLLTQPMVSASWVSAWRQLTFTGVADVSRLPTGGMDRVFRPGAAGPGHLTIQASGWLGFHLTPDGASVVLGAGHACKSLAAQTEHADWPVCRAWRGQPPGSGP